MKKILVLGLVAMLAGCGFSPLYVEKDEGGKWYSGESYDRSITHEMSQVKVEAIGERFGQQLRNELIDILTPKGMPDSPKYKLHIELADKQVSRQALRRDITATRERVKYTVVYYMTENGEELFKADSVAYVSYDILANPYSTTMAQKKAEEDVAKIVANDISLRVGAYFHSTLTKDAKGDIQTDTDR